MEQNQCRSMKEVWLRAVEPWPKECLEWGGMVSKEGYGVTGGYAIHRLVYAKLVGAVDARCEYLDRTCGNLRCFNPAHMSVRAKRIERFAKEKEPDRRTDIVVENGVARIRLNTDRVVLVNEEDVGLVNDRLWYEHKNSSTSYARSTYKIGEQLALAKTVVLMHRLICPPREGYCVDHINGNGLDNRRENLRECTHSQNMRNRKAHKNNKLKIKGVYANGPFYTAIITVDKSVINLGVFDTIEEARDAYNAASEKYHGEFGKLNATV